MGDQYLTLVRHAKSGWPNPGEQDHERQLNERGNYDAPLVANHLAQINCIPNLLLVSSAARAQQTAAYLMDSLSLSKNLAVVVPDLYLSAPGTILQVVRDFAESSMSVMVVAHNPGLEDLSAILAQRPVSPMTTMAVHHFSCSSFEVLATSEDTHTRPPGDCHLLFEISPSGLR